MDFDPNGYLEMYSSKKTTTPPIVAVDCKHFMQPSDLAAPIQEADWEDLYEPTALTAFASTPTIPLLCKTCENAIRTELRDAEVSHLKLWANRDDAEAQPPIEARTAVNQRHVRGSIRVANFEGRVADRKADVNKAREQKWEARKKVKFAVEEGKGAGEMPKKKKEKVSAIAVGWIEVEQPSTSAQQDEDDDSSYVFAYRPDQN